jgi:hypothetical protein
MNNSIIEEHKQTEAIKIRIDIMARGPNAFVQGIQQLFDEKDVIIEEQIQEIKELGEKFP